MVNLRSKAHPDKALGLEEKISFSLYESDLKSLRNMIATMSAYGLVLDRTKVVRCLLHTTPELDLSAYAIVQFRADCAKEGPREMNYVAERFTVVLPVEDIAKLRGIVADLGQKGIKMNISYVLRSLLRGIQPSVALAPAFKRFLADYPDGRSRAARARKA
jgi:hypothetical protein